MEKIKIIIDTDLGDDVDDAAAIALAVNSPEIEVIGITTVYKNVVARAQMAADLLRIYNRSDIPVYAGQGMPIIERFDVQEEPIQYEILQERHEIDVSVYAADFIIETIARDTEVCIVAMGPMTNLALAFLKAPGIMKNARIIGMGGAFLNSLPEWNIKCDPEAARIVTDYSNNLTLLGLDVTKFCKLTTEQLKSVSSMEDTRVRYLYKGMQKFMHETGYPITLHDVLIIAYLIDETVLSLKQGDFTVELRGELTRGTIVHKTNYYEIENESERLFHYAVGLDLEKFRNIVMGRVFKME